MTEIILTRIVVIALALAVDFIIGDPQNPLHPMRMVGSCIALGVKAYRRARPASRAVQFTAGMALSLAVIGSFTAVTWGLVWAGYRLSLYLGVALEALLCYFFLAAKSLKDESMKVHRSLVEGDIEAARFNLSMVVSRDTAELGPADIAKGAVETVAENFSDGVFSPLFYMVIGGAPLGMLFKAASTLDSMIGYKTDEFLYFGRFAARLDDVLNYLPARLSAWLLIAGSLLTGLDARQAARIHARDKRNHASPNSAHGISAVAGALGVQLGGPTSYHGELLDKPTIGDDLAELEPGHIAAANRLMYAATLLGAALLLLGAAALALASQAWQVAHV